jgi:hypothetical protein
MSINWRRHIAIDRQFLLGRFLVLCLVFASALGQARGATISLIQSNFAPPQTPQTTVTVKVYVVGQYAFTVFGLLPN